MDKARYGKARRATPRQGMTWLGRATFVVATGVMAASTVLSPHLFVFAFVGWLVAGVMVMPEGER